MRELIINSSIQYALLLVIPLIMASTLRWAKLRAWSIVGGFAGGILLGPLILGSVAPSYWESTFRGGEDEHGAIMQLERQQQANLIAANTLGVDQDVLLQMQAEQWHEQAILHEQWEAGKWRDQRTIRIFAIALIVLILLSGNDRRSKRKTLLTTNKSDQTPLIMSLSVGAWSSVIPMGGVAIISYMFWDASLVESVAIGACIGAGPWTLSRWEQRAADCSEADGSLFMVRCGRVAWGIAGTATIYSAWQMHGAMALAWLLPILLLPTIWMMPPKGYRLLRWFVDFAAIPSVVATALVLIDPREAFQFWPFLVVILFCADARWFGGIVGLWILGGRTSSDAMRLSIPLVDAGISQLCLVTLLYGVGALTPPLAFAGITGALFLEITAPIRFKFTTPPVQN